jgi:hypothetical protein
MEIKIPKHGWVQIGGDMDPGTYGGTIAQADGTYIDIRQIQPVREYLHKQMVPTSTYAKSNPCANI